MKNSGKYLSEEQIRERVANIHYVREKGGNPIGIIVKTKAGHYGWSLCRKGDVLDRGLGVLIACNRAKEGVRAELEQRVAKVLSYKRGYCELNIERVDKVLRAFMANGYLKAIR